MTSYIRTLLISTLNLDAARSNYPEHLNLHRSAQQIQQMDQGLTSEF